MFRLDDRVALVTGGALGIGRATCLRLAEAGARVVITDIDDEAAVEVVSRISAGGGSAAFWHLDVSSPGEVEEVFAKVEDGYGRLDVLVNNAGIAGVNRPTDRVTPEEWDRVMAVNVRGVYLCTRAAIPVMRRAGGGSIVNLSSIYGIIGAPDLPPYHASKGAVRLMTKTDALLYAEDGIRVNSVHPGYVWTHLVESLARDSEQGVEEFRSQLDAAHPIGHVGEPDDIAWGIVYLASDAAKFVTGSELVIDGGYTAR